MKRLTRESRIVLGKKTYEVGELLGTLPYIQGNEVKGFFNELGLRIPRQIRIDALKESMLASVIRTRAERETLADELNYRLSWYNEYSDTQLENLILFFDDKKVDLDYLEKLWLKLLLYMGQKQVSVGALDRLIKTSQKSKQAHGSIQNMKDFNLELVPLFFDLKGRIDGLTLVRFRPVLYRSSTIVELRELGLKYNVNVPKRLRKAELFDIIIAELKVRNLWTIEEETKIHAMTVMLMTRYAKDNKIKASTELKKEEVIEYILSNAKETQDVYFTPAKDAYVMIDPIAPEEIIVDESEDSTTTELDFSNFDDETFTRTNIQEENQEPQTREIITARIIYRNFKQEISKEDEQVLTSEDELAELIKKEANAEIHITRLTIGPSGEILSRETEIIGKVVDRPESYKEYTVYHQTKMPKGKPKTLRLDVKNEEELIVVINNLQENEGLLVEIDEVMNDGTVFSTQRIIYGIYETEKAVDAVYADLKTISLGDKYHKIITVISQVKFENDVLTEATLIAKAGFDEEAIVNNLQENEAIVFASRKYDENNNFISESARTYGNLQLISTVNYRSFDHNGDLQSEEQEKHAYFPNEDEIKSTLKPHDVAYITKQIFNEKNKEVFAATKILTKDYLVSRFLTLISKDIESENFVISKLDADLVKPINIVKLEQTLGTFETIIIDEVVNDERGRVVYTKQTVLGNPLKVELVIVRNSHDKTNEIINTNKIKSDHFFDLANFEETVLELESAIVATKVSDVNGKIIFNDYFNYGIKLSDELILELLADQAPSHTTHSTHFTHHHTSYGTQKVIKEYYMYKEQSGWKTLLNVILYFLQVVLLVFVFYSIITFFWRDVEFLKPINDLLAPVLDKLYWFYGDRQDPTLTWLEKGWPAITLILAGLGIAIFGLLPLNKKEDDFVLIKREEIDEIIESVELEPEDEDTTESEEV